MLELLTTPQTWFALFSLTALELILGIDNVVFISILSSRLPRAQQLTAWRVGLGLAMITRICLLLSITWLIGLDADLFSIAGHGVSGREMILFAGGLFLVGKSLRELGERLSTAPASDEELEKKRYNWASGLAATLVQIMLLDMVFSIDSILTAVGLAQDVLIMIAAVVIAICITMAAARQIHGFIQHHQRVKTIGLAFLVLIGIGLVTEGLGVDFPKGYLYLPIGFALAVELLNIRIEHVEAARTAPAEHPGPEVEPDPAAERAPGALIH